MLFSTIVQRSVRKQFQSFVHVGLDDLAALLTHPLMMMMLIIRPFCTQKQSEKKNHHTIRTDLAYAFKHTHIQIKPLSKAIKTTRVRDENQNKTSNYLFNGCRDTQLCFMTDGDAVAAIAHHERKNKNKQKEFENQFRKKAAISIEINL